MIDVENITNQIINADCMDILKELPDKCIDLVVTSPPYNLNIAYNSYSDNLPYKDYLKWCKQWIKECSRILKPAGRIAINIPLETNLNGKKFIESDYSNILKENFIEYEEYKNWCSQWFKGCERVSKCVLFTCDIVNLPMWYEIETPYWLYIWYKNNQNSPSKIGGFNIFEPFLIYGKPQKRIGQDGFSMPIAMQKNYEKHPVPKLLKAWEYVIDKFTNENDLILDCFSGSGTTAVACHNLKRRFICIEKDKDYWKASVERLKNAQAQQKLF